ncbi:hypothetical protein MVES_001724 [Malassezia vespertilionis]|uniref:NECAP PHear domain-containing protein n=1 Tax=Malassezia vespertilionis TaxID=2020962 RepID=A0A2N1JD95_9BASI|nr:hypothetical protein MVES_001724 [Malassezia vespertilionis]
MDTSLFIARECYVYRVPPRTSAGGYRASEWGDVNKSLWKGSLRIVEFSERCEIQELFAAAPYDISGKAVEAVLDSSRYFVVRVESDQKQSAYIGIGAFDFNVALQDWTRGPKPSPHLPAGPRQDFCLPEGETLNVKLPALHSSGGATQSATRKGFVLPPPPPSGPLRARTAISRSIRAVEEAVLRWCKRNATYSILECLLHGSCFFWSDYFASFGWRDLAPVLFELLGNHVPAEYYGSLIIAAVTGALTPMGLVTMASLAHQGAHIIALVPAIQAPNVVQLIDLLRESTRSENIFAEECDMSDLISISAFAAQWSRGTQQQTSAPGTATGLPNVTAPGVKDREALFPHEIPKAHRLDTILFLPHDAVTYKVGARLRGSCNKTAHDANTSAECTYVMNVLAPFHLINSMLPSLLLMPPNRDVRIVSMISPWYAAGLPELDAVVQPIGESNTRPVYQPWTYWGSNTLHWIVLAKELQRRVNLLAEADTRPRTKLPGLEVEDTITVQGGTIGEQRAQPSHISSLLVCPGFERDSQLSVFFGTVLPFHAHRLHSLLLHLVWLLLFSFFWLFGKSASRGADAALWGATARLSAPLQRLGKANDDKLAPEHSEAQWGGLQPGQFPPIPAHLDTVQGASALWNATEERVKALLHARKLE